MLRKSLQRTACTLLALVLLVALVPGSPVMSSAAVSITIDEFPVPSTPFGSCTQCLGGITAGPDANLWFNEPTSGKIGRITSAGVITEFVDGAPVDIAAGPDGNLWFTDFGGAIGRTTPAGVVTEFPVPTPGSGPLGIVSGPDGNVWFTERFTDTIGRITPAGVVTEFRLPTAGSLPNRITPGPDGNLWFTETTANQIGRITPAGAIAEFPLPAGSAPAGITTGPDGALWFAESATNKIGRITLTGVLTEFAVPTASSAPVFIAVGPDGNLWFTELFGNQIARMTLAGVVTEFPIPTAGSQPFRITAGPDGNIWFAEFVGGKIGRLNTGLGAGASACINPPPGLVSWWPGAGNAQDVQGTNNGTTVGAVTFVPGKVGQAFNFPGNGFVQIPNSASLQPTQVTVDGWIKPVFTGRPKNPFDADTIFEKIDALGSPFRGYGLFVLMDPRFFGVPVGTVDLFVVINGTSFSVFSSSQIPDDGTYHHVAGTYDGTTATVFLDGVQVGSSFLPGSITHGVTADGFIGRENANGFTQNSVAAIDEIDVFGRALSAAEISAIFGAGSGGKCRLGADTIPPTTTASASPGPNANGWNRTDVTVALSATDNPGGSGVKSITFSASGAQTVASTTVAGSTASVTISVEGTTTLSFFATDNAGNQEFARTLAIKIDKTPPEAVVQFDRAGNLQVLGTDALSGVPAAPTLSTAAVGGVQTRTYTVTDAAGNTLVLVAQVKQEPDEAKATLVSLQYNGGPALTPALNQEKFESVSNLDGSQTIEQVMTVGTDEVKAEFQSATNQTTIRRGTTTVVRPGLVLLQLVTTRGQLSIPF